MTQLFWQTLKVAPIIAASLLTATSAVAQTAPTEVNSNNSVDETLEKINSYQRYKGNRSMSQVTNVNQLRDVSPTDWAYEALRSLVDRYGCIAGFPNQTYRGNQALSRYEFAAGLNSCLNQIERLIASSESVIREDLDTINRLTQEFEAELATLGGRIDNIESRTAFLEDNQFSTTTKLKGEAIFATGNTFGDKKAVQFGESPTEDIDSQATLSNRVRLNFDTSFYGKDRLRTRLEAGNTEGFRRNVSGTDSTRVGFDASNENNVEISDLYYRFPLIDTVTVYFGAVGLDLDDIFDVGNPILESSGTGALSRFNRRNPLAFRGPEGAGAGFNWELIEDKFTFTALYLGEDDSAGDPSSGRGIFNGSFSTGAQLVYSPIENLNINFAYVRSFEKGDEVAAVGSTGSAAGNTPFTRTLDPSDPDFDPDGDNEVGVDTSSDKFNLGFDWQFAERYVVAAWGGYSSVNEQGNLERDGDIWTFGVNFSVLDLGKEGAALSVAGGMIPRFTTSSSIPEDRDTSYLLEVQYKFPVNDNILITPGGYAVFNPNSNDRNDTLYVGLIRTTFQF